MSYRKFDRNWKVFGRVTQKRVEGPNLILGLESGKSLKTFYREEHESLNLNDWVALDENDKLVLVTPSLSEPRQPTLSKALIKSWNLYMGSIRKFFETQEFLEIQTPTLVACPGTEPTLDAFETQLKIGVRTQKVFLPTSPELHLKKALSMGFDKIYEMAKCYRNGEVTELHQPEFWMLEWYRSFANLLDLQQDCVKLVFSMADQLQVPRPSGVECYTVRQLFRRYLSFELKPSTTKSEFQQLVHARGLHFQESYSIDDLFFLLMMECIEPQLPKDKLIFVEKYPPFQAALARKDEEGWAERFEMYWKGLELANAFDELNDPKEQRARSKEDLQKREGRNPIDLDEEFFQCLEGGVPPSAGIALGVERLFMALMGMKNLNEIRFFPVSP